MLLDGAAYDASTCCCCCSACGVCSSVRPPVEAALPQSLPAAAVCISNLIGSMRHRLRSTSPLTCLLLLLLSLRLQVAGLLPRVTSSQLSLVRVLSPLMQQCKCIHVWELAWLTLRIFCCCANCSTKQPDNLCYINLNPS